MALALYQVLTPYALTVPTGDLTGAYPVSMVVPPGSLFAGDAASAVLLGLVGQKALASSAPGTSTPSRFELFTQTP